MARTLALVALVAIAITGASAGTTYDTTPKTGTVNVGAAPYMDCKDSIEGGKGSITVSWSNFTQPATKMAIKLCFTKDKIFERPWRKYVKTINKNKQCWQTAKLAKFFKAGVPFSASGSETIPLPENTAPSTYTVQVLSQDASGAYQEWGDSLDTSCKVTTTIYENQTEGMKGTMGFFTVFSIVVLIVAYGYDRSKQA